MLLERGQPKSLLDDALHTARGGAGRIVSIEGEAGIGKTSLALTFVEAHRGDAQIYVGGCEHLSTPEPLGPLRDIERDSGGRFTYLRPVSLRRSLTCCGCSPPDVSPDCSSSRTSTGPTILRLTY